MKRYQTMSIEEIYKMIASKDCYIPEERGCPDDSCKKCIIEYLNEEIKQTKMSNVIINREKFVEILKAIKVLYPWARWLAMNSNGCAMVYETKPGGRTQYSYISGSRKEIVGIAEWYAEDWKESLIDIDNLLERMKGNKQNDK